MPKIYKKLILNWWGLVKYNALNNKKEKQQQLESTYSKIKADENYKKLPLKMKKRLFIFRMGNTAVRLYLKFISKQQKTKHLVDESLFK